MINQGQPTTARELFPHINDMLMTMVAIENAIFKFRLRNLVRAMDFASYFETLEALTNTLEELEVTVSRNQTHWERQLGPEGYGIVSTYLKRLKVAAARLRDVAGRLDLKAQGQPYSHTLYKEDVSRFNEAAKAYAALGNQMNALFAQPHT